MTGNSTRSPRALVGTTRSRADRIRRALPALLLATLIVALVVPQAAFAGLALYDPAAFAPVPTAAPLALTSQSGGGVAVIDYAGGFSASKPARFKSAGVGIAIRYVGSASWKSLRRNEANALRNAGIDIAVVYETNANWMLAGRAAGVAAAKKARAATIAAGGPRRPFIYFACDVGTNQYSKVNECLRGAASVLGADRVGIYGSYAVCDNALSSGYATKAWQTEAWSQGKVLPKAALFQRAHRIDGNLGLDYDSNLVRVDDIGQWGFAGLGTVAWVAEPPVAPTTLTGVDFATPSIGWAVGSDGRVRRTNDGGASWFAQSVPTTAALTAVHFADGATGWAVGLAGTMLHTGDGGSNWTTQSVPTSAGISAVEFVDTHTGWAVGESGRILHTDDGGTTWTFQPAPMGVTLSSVRFTSATSGWAVGALGTILHTINGGASWVVQPAPVSARLTAVDFSDAVNGWAVGENGTILRTASAGTKWSVQSAPTSATLSAVRFTDDLSGWAVGEAGTLLHTADSGSTWTTQSVPTGSALAALDFTDAHTGWVVGADGTVVRGTGSGLQPFGTIAGAVTDANTGRAIPGAQITVGARLAAPVTTDGTYVAARLRPGTYSVTFAHPLYITQSVSVVVSAAGRTVVRVKMVPRTATAIGRPSLDTTAPLAARPVVLSATLSPSVAATAGATTISGWRYEAKTVTVTVKVKGKPKKVKVKVWSWRLRFKLRMAAKNSGLVAVQTALGRGSWRMQATFAGSGRFLPSTSARTSFVVR